MMVHPHVHKVPPHVHRVTDPSQVARFLLMVVPEKEKKRPNLYQFISSLKIHSRIHFSVKIDYVAISFILYAIA